MIGFGCLIVGFALLITFGFLGVWGFDMWFNTGREVIEVDLKGWDFPRAMGVISTFFQQKGFFPQVYGPRIYVAKGDTLIMGKKVFDITLTPTGEGVHLKGHFFLEGTLPKYWKMSRYGYPAILPRRQGWQVKKELFEKLGFSIEQIDKLSRMEK